MKFLIPVIILLTTACYYDSEEILFPEVGTDCNLVDLSFSEDITLILNNNCWSCHSNANAASFGGNLKLQNYADIVQNIDALIGSINHNSSYPAMPKNGGKISDCQIQKIETWNTDGLPNN
ncbi:MAG: hypothetical protein K9H58_19520 [Bacteroidales bacterium]|nr:hypothetical protein [Bacteroidales bacterium]